MWGPLCAVGGGGATLVRYMQYSLNVNFGLSRKSGILHLYRYGGTLLGLG